VHGSNTQLAGVRVPALHGDGALTLVIEDLPLAAGTYLVSFSLHSADHRVNYHRLDHALPIVVTSETPFEGVTRMASRWETEAG
jgi:hypothetical protein